MRTLRIDFTAENILPDGEYIGRIGEHNATHLIITPPSEMAECNDIINYVAAFVTEGKIIRSDFYPKAEQITIPLCSQLTQDHSLGVQLEGYDGTGGLVVKSAVVSELRLLPSAGGDETDFDGENGGIVSQINLNTLARHEHSNKSVLDGISEKSGILIYNGEPVTAQKTQTVEVSVLNGDACVESTGSGYLFSVADNGSVPENADIKKVEFYVSVENNWVDIRSIMKYDYSVPVLIQTFRSFCVDNFIYLACVDYYTGIFNKFYDYAINYQVEKLRITYATESAE